MEKAILLCQQEEFNARVSYDLRVYLLKYLVEMINQNLEGPAGIADRAVASSSCQRLGDHLRELADEWKSLSTPGEQKEHDFQVNFYEGCLFSTRGVLESDSNDPSKAKQPFNEAAARFQKARTLTPLLKKSADKQKLLDIQERKLKSRRGNGD
jgi:hypothetical protein